MIPVVTYVLGFVSGWATRSIADSPQGGAVKLVEMAYDAKERLVRWTLMERERLEDILAEARARAGQDGPNGEPSHNNEARDKEKDQDKGKDKDEHRRKERGEA
jgi:hypothetical protein